MIPRSMSYGARFKSSDRSHIEELKDAYNDERQDILARSRKIQQETNRRRKALAVKRKLEAAKEEKRRQEILANRREQQREATERFQRLGKPREQLLEDEEEVNYQYHHPSKASPALEEALRNVNARTNYYTRQTSRETPVLEDALRAVRGSPNQFRNGIQDNTVDKHVRTGRPLSGTQRDRPPSGTKKGRPGSAVKNNHVSYNQSTMGPADRIQEQALEVANRADLQSRSLLQTSNSRTLFEQQLQQQQSLFMEQQKESLYHFNSAIQKEMDQDDKVAGLEKEETPSLEKELSAKMTRSDSLSSVDSLEASNGVSNDPSVESNTTTFTSEHGNIHHNINVAKPSQDNPSYNLNNSSACNSTGPNSSVWGHVPNSVKSSNVNTSTVGFVLHRSPSNPTNIAVVSPSVIQTKHETDGYGNNNKQKTLDLGSFTPNKDYRNAGGTITGPNSYGNQDEMNPVEKLGNNVPTQSVPSSTSEPYSVIRTLSNGRSNGQFYQDSVVNNAETFILHGDAGIYATASDFRNPILGAVQPEYDIPTNILKNPHGSKPTMTNVTATSDYTMGTPNKTPESNTCDTTTKNGLAYSPSNYTDGSGHGENAATSSVAAAVSSNVIPTGFSHMAYLPHPPNVSAPTVRPTVTMADMRASSFAGNVNTTMNQFATVDVPKAKREVDDMSEGSVEHAEDDAETQPPKPKVLKGILKKTKQPTVMGRGVSRGGRIYSAGTYTARLRAQGRGRGATGSPNNITDHDASAVGKERPSSSSSVRDSIEVARDQLSARKSPTQKPKKKSIRWADMTYSDEENCDPDEAEQGAKEVKNTKNNYMQIRQKEPIINTQSKIPTGSNKPRPYSAKLTTNTPKVETSVRQSRVASAGARRAPFVRPSIRNSLAASRAQMNCNNGPNSSSQQNSWVSKPVTNTSPAQNTSARPSVTNQANTTNPTSNGQCVDSKVSQNQDKLASSVTAADIRKSVEGAVYDSNGIRLDRTPTDEEINWLWDKVRTCLSRQSTADSISGDNHSEKAELTGTGSRPTAQMSSKYIDGTTLAPQFRTSTRVSTNYNNGISNDTSTLNSTYPLKKKISMETLNTYNRRVSSATQKKSPNINSSYLQTNGGPVYNNNSNLTYNSGYNNSSNIYQQPQHNPHFSSHGPSQAPSMGVPNGYNDQAPSALSLEEQKLLQSLERLNERLKAARI